MFQIFTVIADTLINAMGLNPHSPLGSSVHFFVEDTLKILVLLVVMIYGIAWLRASLNIEKIRDYLKSRHRWQGYIMGAMFGAMTPFCSCSSIPLFLGFTTARIPLGITMSFLITSPMINEVAIVLLGSLLGWKFTVVYVATGLTIGIFSGWVLDLMKAERFLKPFLLNTLDKPEFKNQDQPLEIPEKLSIRTRHQFAWNEMCEIFGRVWKWVLVGVGVGAGLHGFVPEEWVTQTLGDGQWWSVPVAVLMGIPLYANATGIIPVMEALLTKGLPVGTTLAFSMSTIAASFPEFILLKQVMEWKLLAILFVLLLTAFTLTGWLFNAFWGSM
ncbi:MAG: permease [SAR324 cluster bacterium]|nr:permease [SAR324 cluster bacterium]